MKTSSAWPILLTSVAVGAAVVTMRAQQAPTFRSSVDLIAVDVQVVDKDGRPIGPLGPEKFTVSIGGRPRKVISADYVRNAEAEKAADRQIIQGANAANFWPSISAVPGRTYVIAIDVMSFGVGDSRGVVAAAQGFIDHLEPNDRVGVYAFPLGPKLQPSLDHFVVKRQLDSIVGQHEALHSVYNLSPSEIIDITSESAASAAKNLGRSPAEINAALMGDESNVIRRVQLRECGTDTRCVEDIKTEAQNMAFMYENQVVQSLDGLRSLLQDLTTYSGRKTVVLMSAGMPVSDRPGGRPDVGDLPKILGQEAAHTNTNIYALQVDSSEQVTTAENRKVSKAPSNRARDAQVSGLVLDQFAGASGGAMLRVLLGSGEMQLNRVLRETSSHYLLGVEPAEIDRDGKARDLKVKVNQKGVTVRSRTWVVVPKKT